MKSQAFSAEGLSVSPHSFVVCLAAACLVVEMVKRSRVFLFEGVSPSLHSLGVCPAAASEVENVMSRDVSSEVFLELVLSHALDLCLFCCAQAFLSVLVTSEGEENEELRKHITTYYEK